MIGSAGASVAAVVVTHNRKVLLQRCIAALVEQTRRPDALILVDNASTDGTEEMLKATGYLALPELRYLRLASNRGGAGGFAAGLAHARACDQDWIWMMDDDAEPEPDALAALLGAGPAPGNLYGSVPVSGEGLSWAITVDRPEGQRRVFRVGDLPPIAPVEFLPFLGFLVHRSLVEQVGLPDEGFFIAADDVEYCLRAREAGAKLFVVAASRINHPRASNYTLRLPGRDLYGLRLPPWKRYYDTRNRLLIARRYFGIRMLTQTIPSLLLRWGGVLVYEPQRLRQTWAFLAGLIDGLRGLTGRRHQRWGLRP